MTTRSPTSAASSPRSEDRRRAEREREEARVEAARLKAHLEAAEQRSVDTGAAHDELRAQLAEIASAGPLRALRLRRELRARPVA